MGFEVTLRAVPQEARSRFAGLGGDEEAVAAAIEEIERSAAFACLLDRRFDRLRFALGRVVAPDAADEAVLGAAELGDAVRSGQGFAYRWTDARGVAGVVCRLDGVDEAALVRATDPSAMAEAGVYKAAQAEAGAVAACVRADFLALRQFYRRSAAAGLAVLVSKD